MSSSSLRSAVDSGSGAGPTPFSYVLRGWGDRVSTTLKSSQVWMRDRHEDNWDDVLFWARILSYEYRTREERGKTWNHLWPILASMVPAGDLPQLALDVLVASPFHDRPFPTADADADSDPVFEPIRSWIATHLNPEQFFYYKKKRHVPPSFKVDKSNVMEIIEVEMANVLSRLPLKTEKYKGTGLRRIDLPGWGDAAAACLTKLECEWSTKPDFKGIVADIRKELPLSHWDDTVTWADVISRKCRYYDLRSLIWNRLVDVTSTLTRGVSKSYPEEATAWLLLASQWDPDPQPLFEPFQSLIVYGVMRYDERKYFEDFFTQPSTHRIPAEWIHRHQVLGTAVLAFLATLDDKGGAVVVGGGEGKEEKNPMGTIGGMSATRPRTKKVKGGIGKPAKRTRVFRSKRSEHLTAEPGRKRVTRPSTATSLFDGKEDGDDPRHQENHECGGVGGGGGGEGTREGKKHRPLRTAKAISAALRELALEL